MLIVIEGLDRTGKTTFAWQLANRHKLEYRHFDKPVKHPLDEYLEPLADGPPHAVFDRYHLGELVWPKVFSRHTEYDQVMRTYHELLLMARGAVLVKTERDLDDIAAAAKRDGEDIAGMDIDKIHFMFEEAFATSILRRWRYNLAHAGGAGDTREPIQLGAGGLAKYAHQLAAITPRFIGQCYMPDLMLVGDQVGDFNYTLPFVPHKATSGYFLIKHILRTPTFPLTKTLIVNSLDPYGNSEPLTDLCAAAGNPTVVALGNLASMRLTAQGIPHAKTYHPQYVRRFRTGKGDEYVRDIMTKGEYG